MFRQITLILFIFGFTGLILGCGSSSTSPSADSEDKVKIAKALAELSPKDQEVARKQKICPVTDEPLGSMGVPDKVPVKGHDVFICCKGCKESLLEEPEKYLKKLGHDH